MKAIGARSLSTVLGWILTYVWFCAWLACLAFAVMPMLGIEGLQFRFPAEIGHGLVDERVGPGGTWSLETTQVLVTTPPDRAWLPSLVSVPFVALLAFVLGRLRAIFRSLRDGSPFVPANARRLRSVGYAVLVFEALRVVVTSTVIGPALEKLRPVAGKVIRASDGPDWTVVFLGLAVLVLAEVFRRGTQIQDDQDLTV